MILRKLGDTGIKISQLGFGAMRFPLIDQYDPTTIDEPMATKMLRYAIDNGVNYLDTAYPYHRQASESFLGRSLKGSYRQKVYLATKMPVWLVKSKEDPQKYFEEQLKRLQSDCIDMYLLHSLGKNAWQTTNEYDILNFLDRIRKSGQIRFTGFSCHDELPLFKEIVDAYPWTLCLIQLNYVDDHSQAGLEGLEYAYEKGLAVMIMEPLRGGKLAGNVPREIMNIIGRSYWKQTPAQFALRWVLNRPEVSCVLSGMSSLQQVRENVAFAAHEHMNTITPGEMELYTEAKGLYQRRTKVNCTQCGYCMPCSQKIPISFILELYNDACMYNAVDDSRRMYKIFVTPEKRADQCTMCRECEDKCPQHIQIVNSLKAAHDMLAEERDKK
jgi:predicted aldo/keto reductase-like oxidoreductase